MDEDRKNKLYALVEQLLTGDGAINESTYLDQIQYIKEDLLSGDESAQKTALHILGTLLEKDVCNVKENVLDILKMQPRILDLDGLAGLHQKCIRKFLSENAQKELLEMFVICQKSDMKFTSSLQEVISHKKYAHCAKNILLGTLLPSIFDKQNVDDMEKLGYIDLALEMAPVLPISLLSHEECQAFLAQVFNYVTVISDVRSNNFANWHKLWILLVRLLQTKLHRSMSLMNKLLRVVEHAFRNVSSDERVKGYVCWKELIAVISLDLNYLSGEKQLKLILSPLKAKFSKQDAVICKRFEVFVFLLEKLQGRAVLVLKDYLEFSFGQVGEQSDPAKCGLARTLPTLWVRSAKVLMAILGHSHTKNEICLNSEDEIRFSSPVLNSQNISGVYYYIINSIAECSRMLREVEFSESKDIVLRCLWRSLLRIILEDDVIQAESCFALLGKVLDKFHKENISAIIFEETVNCDKPKSLDFIVSQLDHFLEIIFSVPLRKQCYLQVEKLVARLGNLQSSVVQSQVKTNLFSSFVKFKTCEENVDFIVDVWILVANLEEDYARVHSIDFLLWPILHLHQISEKTKEVMVFEHYQKQLTPFIEKSGDLHLALFKHFEKTLKNNPLLLGNILPIVAMFTPKVERIEIINVTLEILTLMLQVPATTEATNQREVIESYFYKILDCGISKIKDETIVRRLCHCLEQLLKLKRYGVLESLEKYLKNVPDDFKSTYAKYNLLDLLMEIFEKESDLQVTEKTHKLMALLRSAKTPQQRKDLSKIVPSGGRSAKIANLMKKIPQSPKKQSESPLRLFGKDIETHSPLKLVGTKLKNAKTTPQKKNQSPAPKVPPKFFLDDDSNSKFVLINSEVKIDKDKLTEHQKETLKKRREDIPALYQDLSQSVSQSFDSSSVDSKTSNGDEVFKKPMEIVGEIDHDEAKIDKEVKAIKTNEAEEFTIENLPLSVEKMDGIEEMHYIETKKPTKLTFAKGTEDLKTVEMDTENGDNEDIKMKEGEESCPLTGAELEPPYPEEPTKEDETTADKLRSKKLGLELQKLSMNIVGAEEFVSAGSKRKRKSLVEMDEVIGKKKLRLSSKDDGVKRKNKKKLEREGKKILHESGCEHVCAETPDKTESEQQMNEDIENSSNVESAQKTNRKRGDSISIDDPKQRCGTPRESCPSPRMLNSKFSFVTIRGKNKKSLEEKSANNNSQSELLNVTPLSPTKKLVEVNLESGSKNRQKKSERTSSARSNEKKKRKRVSTSDEDEVIESSQESNTSNVSTSTLKWSVGKRLSVTEKRNSLDPLKKKVAPSEPPTSVCEADTTLICNNGSPNSSKAQESDLKLSPKGTTKKQLKVANEEESSRTKKVRVANVADRAESSRVKVKNPSPSEVNRRRSPRGLDKEEKCAVTKNQAITFNGATQDVIEPSQSPRHRTQSQDTQTQGSEQLGIDSSVQPLLDVPQRAQLLTDSEKECALMDTASMSLVNSDELGALEETVVKQKAPDACDCVMCYVIPSEQIPVEKTVEVVVESSSPLKEGQLTETQSPSEQSQSDKTQSPIKETPETPEKDVRFCETQETPAHLLPASPVTTDTPNRTSELLDNTSDISPINTSKSSPDREELNDFRKMVPVALKFDHEDDEHLACKQGSPEKGEVAPEKLVETSSITTVKPDIAVEEIVETTDSPPKQSERNVKNLSYSTEKEAANSFTFMKLESPAAQRLFSKRKSGHGLSPSASRIMKLMSNVKPFSQSECNDEINKEDLLTFSREVPSPLAVPKGSILKRKYPDTLEDGMSPSAKRKRVNFSDPCTTSKKLFLKEEAVPSQCPFTFNEINKDEIERQFLELFTANRVPCDTQSEPSSCETETNDPLVLREEGPIYPNLINCDESIGVVARKLTSPMLVNALLGKLAKSNIKTIGELARQSEAQISTFPFKIPPVATVYRVLDEYYKRTNFKKDFDNKVDEAESEEKSPLRMLHNIAVKMELSKIVEKAHTENVSLDTLCSAVLGSADKKDVLLWVKTHFRLEGADLLEEAEYPSAIKKITNELGTAKLFELIRESSEEDTESYINSCIDQRSLPSLVERRKLEEVESAVWAYMEKEKCSKSDLLRTCFFPYINAPDLLPYFSTLNIIELSDVVIARLSTEDSSDFIARILNSSKSTDETRTRLLSNFSIEEFTRNIVERGTSKDVISSFTYMFLTSEKNKEDLVHIFRLVSDSLVKSLPASQLMDLSIEFQRKIPIKD